MPTRNISLTTEQDTFIQTVVESGEYQNASEAVRDALRALQQRRTEDALRLDALRAALAAGDAALAAGEFIEVDASDLPAYIASLAPASARRRRPAATRRKRAR